MQIIAHRRPQQNLHSAERLASVLGGGALAYSGLARGRAGIWRALSGAALIARGLAGHCPAYQALGVNTAAAHPGRLDVRASAAVTVQQPRARIFALWRNFENLPRFMKHLISVETVDAKRSRWVARGPGGKRIEWLAEMINEVPDQLIAWKSLPGSDVDSAGSVHFQDAPGGRGTEIRVELQYSPPAGIVGAYAAKLLGVEPEQEISADLLKLKQYLETGEIAVAATHPRSTAGHKRREVIA